MTSTAETGAGAGTDARSGSVTRLRVVFLLRLRPGTDTDFLRAYEAVRWQVDAVPGHLTDQVCRSLSDPDEWLITSEWASAEHFLAWERDPSHRELAAPMIACTTERRSLRFTVLATTGAPPAGSDSPPGTERETPAATGPTTATAATGRTTATTTVTTRQGR